MAENSIVKANIGVGVDGKQAKAGLNTVQQDLKKWADGTVKQLRGQFQEGFTSGLLGGIVGANFSGIANEIGRSIGDWLNETRNLNAELAKTSKELTRAREAAATIKFTDELNPSTLGDSDPARLVGLYKSQLAELDKVRVDFGRKLFDLGEDADPAKKNQLLFAIGLVKRDIEKTKGRIAEVLKPFGGSLEAAKLVPQIQKATSALELQALTWRLTGDEATRAMFAAGGATDDMLAKFDQARARLEDLRRFNAGPLAGSFGMIGNMIGHAARKAHELFPQQTPAWLGIALNAVEMIAKADLRAPKIAADNPALRRGSSAEVSARTRHELSTQQRDAIAEARRQTQELNRLNDTARKLPGEIAAAIALSPL